MKHVYTLIIVILYTTQIVGNFGLGIANQKVDSNDILNQTGSFIYQGDLIHIPGIEMLDLELTYQYNSFYHNSIVNQYLGHIDDVFLGDKPFSKIYELKHGFWIGLGWQINTGGTLMKYHQSYYREDCYGWSCDPFDNLSVQAQNDYIYIQLPNKSYSFKYNSNEKIWKSIDKSETDSLRETDSGYTLIDENGTQYIFEENILDQDLEMRYRKDSGAGGWNKEGRKYFNKNDFYYLSKISAISGEVLNFDYEASPTIYDGGQEDFGNAGELSISSTVIIIDNGAANNNSPEGIGASLGAAAGTALCGPVCGMIGSAIGSALGSLLGNPHDWGTAWKNLYVTPKRLASITDTYGRKVTFEYRNALPAPSTMQELFDSPVDSFQISGIQYTDSNGDQNKITLNYFEDDEKKYNYLNSIIYPDGTRDSFDYVNAQVIYPGYESKNDYLLNSIISRTQKKTDITYTWSDLDGDDFDHFTLKEKTESDNLNSSYMQKTWTYSYGKAEQYVIGEDYLVYGLTSARQVGPSGTIEKTFQKGLLQTFSLPGMITFSYEWDMDNRRLISTTKEDHGITLKTETTEWEPLKNQPKRVKISGQNIQTIEKATQYLYETDEAIKNDNILSIKTKHSIYPESSEQVLLETNWSFKPGDVTPFKKSVVYTSEYYDDGSWESSYISSEYKTETTEFLSYFKNFFPVEIKDTNGFITNRTYESENGFPLYVSEVKDRNTGIKNKIEYYANTGLMKFEKNWNQTRTFYYDRSNRVSKIIYNEGTAEELQEEFLYSNYNRTIETINKDGSKYRKTIDIYGDIVNEEYYESGSSIPYLTKNTMISNVGTAKKKTVRINNNSDTYTQSYMYDSRNRLIESIDTAGNRSTTEFSYSDGYHIQHVTDRDGKTTDYAYDILDRLRFVTLPNGHTFTYTYDSQDKLTKIKKDNTTLLAITRFGNGQPKYETYLSGKRVEYTYLENSPNLYQYRVTTSTEPNSTPEFIIEYNQYDSFGNPKEKRHYYNGNWKEKTNYYYHSDADHALGKLYNIESYTLPDNTFQYRQAYSYNRAGQLIDTTIHLPTVGDSYALSYTYNDMGNLTKISDPEGDTFYTYDTQNRLSNISRNNKSIMDLTYAPGFYGKPDTQALNEGALSVLYGYQDSNLRPRIKTLHVSLNDDLLARYAVTNMSKEGLIYNKTTAINNKNYTVKFSYDETNQIKSAKYDNGTVFEYQYDDLGNRTTYVSPGHSVAYSIDSSIPIAMTLNGIDTELTYDSAANLTQKLFSSDDTPFASINYTYDAESRLKKWETSEGESLEFLYNDTGELLTLSQSGSPTEGFIWGPFNDPLLHLNSKGDISKVVIYTPNGKRVAEYDTEKNSYAYTVNYPDGTPFIIIDDTSDILFQDVIDTFGDMKVSYDKETDILSAIPETSFKLPSIYLKNTVINSNVLFESQKGIDFDNVTVEAPGEAHFRVKSATSLLGLKSTGGTYRVYGATSHSTDAPYQKLLQGKMYFHDLNLYYFNKRWYDPQLGRFLTHDEAEPDLNVPFSTNPYQFVYNNPLSFVDPDGRKAYIMARDLANIPVGTHQFLVLQPDTPSYFTPQRLAKFGAPPLQDLGNGSLGLVLGAHNINNRLQALFFEPNDYQAAKEFMNPSKYTSWHKFDLSVEGYLINHKGIDDTTLIENILRNNRNYSLFESSNPIRYPSFFEQGSRFNSNSWVQSILNYSGGIDYNFDFFGADLGNDLQMPENYFGF